VSVFVIRHAKAGSRRNWDGNDRDRPLSKTGRRQADALVKPLASTRGAAIVSSPYLRCVESVEPLAEEWEVAITPDRRLAEGAGPAGALALVRELAAGGGALCTHGDVLTELLELLGRAGVDLGPDPRCEKGSVWVLEVAGDRIESARYLPPPA
jgi:8-oxo-dGTP diphosphatase